MRHLDLAKSRCGVRIKEKIPDEKGVALVIILLLIGIAVMLVLIAMPWTIDLREEAASRLDWDYEVAADNLARLEYTGEKQDVVAVYDAFNKAYIEVTDYTDAELKLLHIKAYGSSQDTQGKFLSLYFHSFGEYKIKWMTIEELTQLVHRFQDQ